MSDPLSLDKPCPRCKTADSIRMIKNRIHCTADRCSFSADFACPICNASFVQAPFEPGPNGGHYTCLECRQTIPLRKIQYLIENSLYMDHDTRCQYCNNPTIHRKDMNLSNRCFFFPLCSGQANLFGNATESLVFLDFETTGLEVGKDAIIEIGALKIDEEGYEHTFQQFIKPPVPISEKITKITGITTEMVSQAPGLKESMEKLAAFIGTAKLVAHNADFDIPFLLSAILRHGVELSARTVICTLVWAKKIGEPHCSLGALTRKYSIGHKNAHRALADAAATKELFFIFENTGKTPRPEKSVKEYREVAEKLIAKYADFIQR